MQDAISMSRLADPEYLAGGSSEGRVAQFSPDGRRFVIVLKKGDLEHNQNIYSLLLFETVSAFTKPVPQILLALSSSSNDDAICAIKWLEDNETIYFVGHTGTDVPQVYSFNIRTRSLTQITQHTSAVVSFDVTANGKRLVYVTRPADINEQTDGEWGYRDARIILTEDLFDVLKQKPRLQSRWSTGHLYLQDFGGPATELPTNQFVTDLEPPSLSPDGHYVVLLVRRLHVPTGWAEYQDRMIKVFASKENGDSASSQILTYLLLDIASGNAAPLIDAPLGWDNYGSKWAPDGKSVIVSGTYLPLVGVSISELNMRRKTPYVVEVKLPGRNFIKVTDEKLRVKAWLVKTNHVLLAHREAWKSHDEVEAYERQGRVWGRVAVVPDDLSAIEVRLLEDMNTPPKIFVSDSRTGRQSLLLDLNPQFKNLRFGTEQAITWKAGNGYEIEGGLYFPVEYTLGQRYPLIIQTHSFRSDRFWIDGPWSSAFAAQPLAGRGFVVLQVGDAKKAEDYAAYLHDYKQTPKEAPYEMSTYEGAIDYLDKLGLIDRNRIGIIGFSRTVYHVKYALTHSKYRFAAATLADGIDAGYFEYLSFPGIKGTGEALNGAVPFGPGLDLWLQNAPGFNLDKVNCPVRIEAYGLPSVLEGWEWFVGLSRLQRPVDFVLLSHGTHTLERPWDRFISQQGNVDWFSFWLKGEEDSDPSKTNQYVRWRKLRDLVRAHHLGSISQASKQ